MTISVRRVIDSHDFDPGGVCRACKHTRREVSLELILCRYPLSDEEGEKIIRPYAGGFSAHSGRLLSETGYLKSGQPQIRLTAEPSLRDGLIAIAESEDVSLSEIVRRACRAYVRTWKQKQ